MTRKELIQALLDGNLDEQVMISGHNVTSIDNVPAEGGEPGYFDIVGQ